MREDESKTNFPPVKRGEVFTLDGYGMYKTETAARKEALRAVLTDCCRHEGSHMLNIDWIVSHRREVLSALQAFVEAYGESALDD